MEPTVQQVRDMYRAKLDDPDGAVFDDSVFFPAFAEAYDAMFQAMTNFQVPRIEEMIQKNVAPGVTELSPDDLGINNFAGVIFLRERPAGSTQRYTDMYPCDVLPQRPQVDRLIDFNYRAGVFFFVGATTAIDLQVKYDSSGESPTDLSVKILVDNSRTFLANFAVGVSGGRKGRNSTARDCFQMAVGTKYEEGVIGGELFRLINPLVRNRQIVQVARRPFTARQGVWVRRGMPYVQAQQGTTGGASNNNPVQFTSAAPDSTIIGAIDGTNTTFFLSSGQIQTMQLFLNGLGMTFGVDYTFSNNRIDFISPQIPSPGSIITASVILQGYGQ